MTPQQQTPRCRVSERDQKILDHVVRHRITTNEVLHKLFFARRHRNAVAKVTCRLCRDCLLSKFTLLHPELYFTVGPVEVQNRGLPLSHTCSLGPQSLPTVYAALAYANLGSLQHHRLTPSELQDFCPWMDPQLLELPHCLDRSHTPPILELIRVDLGGRPDHVARKCDADIQVRRRTREFDDLLREGRFRLVVVTGSAEKADATKQALDQHVWPDGLQIHLAVVLKLLLLTASSNHGP